MTLKPPAAVMPFTALPVLLPTIGTSPATVAHVFAEDVVSAAAHRMGGAESLHHSLLTRTPPDPLKTDLEAISAARTSGKQTSELMSQLMRVGHQALVWDDPEMTAMVAQELVATAERALRQGVMATTLAVSMAAMASLETLLPEGIGPFLVWCINDPHTPEMVRESAVRILGLVGTDEEQEVLKTIANDARDTSRLRGTALAVLGSHQPMRLPVQETFRVIRYDHDAQETSIPPGIAQGEVLIRRWLEAYEELPYSPVAIARARNRAEALDPQALFDRILGREPASTLDQICALQRACEVTTHREAVFHHLWNKLNDPTCDRDVKRVAARALCDLAPMMEKGALDRMGDASQGAVLALLQVADLAKQNRNHARLWTSIALLWALVRRNNEVATQVSEEMHSWLEVIERLGMIFQSYGFEGNVIPAYDRRDDRMVTVIRNIILLYDQDFAW